MIDRLQHQLEISGGAATLYLAGALGLNDLPALRATCAGLPAHVTTLRVDLHAMTSPSAGAVGAVRAILHDWRLSRGGEFRLSLCTSHLVATYREGAPDVPPCGFAAQVTMPAHALMATFL